ncbi:MAG: hypothetical protein A2X67_09140 [Ignavibacteria bacterium GWA2_55_11]|nr:MAG: hypothetical protein A2X67_09140 [Ignavibacteria bacterium GWA2_55_11]OGU47576.1 MAG: hypothetical protein A2X68_05940 [Ignavibacteria bacterium GWC2_56_12]OGU70636.1 MAG: hypothetical protein A3H45_03055 [Ignavibacteria bacterium RIFCSPLOWO2_02_FULL_55_14]OGU73390.1 MAG: hypothetical protein A3G43_04890 [Ignavibacteria bacterium RIFCSPLOWO2_12_FULL_56_21]
MTTTGRRPFSKVLVANRGEIACRIMRSCRIMGLPTVAVHSDVDKTAMHVSMADEAISLGGKSPGESYLQIDKIIAAAQESHADAIHPGYGFLSENPNFADAVAKAGAAFIGPSGKAIRKLGDKTSARALAIACEVPTIPGSTGTVDDVRIAQEAAHQVGYPVLLKAAAGGGGKGMRIVQRPEEMNSAFRAAHSEAVTAFGDGRLYVEKYLDHPRHVEIQVLADSYGNVVYLGERECSIQRRHQKVIEESPSPVVSPELRTTMGEAAVRIVRAAEYENAATVEFIVDSSRTFRFLEVNTRLQVEHAVTEMVTGLDLVREQILISGGQRLTLTQETLYSNGHAVECRVCAEDPAQNFIPSTGRLDSFRLPSGPFIRVDSGFQVGDEISVYYDSLLAKIIAWAPTREQAVARLRQALQEFRCVGIRTNVAFCLWVLDHPSFLSGDFDTRFVTDHSTEYGRPVVPKLLADATALTAALMIATVQSQPKRVRQQSNNERTWLNLRTDNLR